MGEKVILTHDIGTAGDKAALVTPEGEVVSASYRGYDVKSPNPGWAEQDPKIWWDAVVSSTRELLEKGNFESNDVLGVSFDAMLLSALPVNQQGDSLRPAIIWLDTRAGEESDEILELFDLEEMLEKEIIPPLSPKDPLPKIMWIKNNEQEVFENTHKFLESKGYLIHKCTGEFVTDPSEASLTGMYSLKTKNRAPEIPQEVGIELDQLPDIKETTEVVGSLNQDAARKLGLSEGIPVVCGSGDPTAAAVGSGAVREEDPHLYIGSSGWIALHTRETEFSLSGIGTICSADPEKLLLIGQSESCASCYEWFKNELSQKEQEKAEKEETNVFKILDDKAENSPPGSNGVLFAPWMSGERCPFIDPSIRGGFLNLSFDHEKKDMIRSVLEGVAFNIRWIMEEIIEMGHDVNDINAIGGGAKSRLWLQIMSDVLNKEINQMPNPAYAGCVGTALTAAIGLGIHSDFEEFENLFEPADTFSPDPENVETYNKMYNQFKQVQDNFSSVCSALNK